jgi:hypothetical protein
MKLHTLDRQLAMAQFHNRLSISLHFANSARLHLQLIRQPLLRHNQRGYCVQVIANGKPLKMVFPSCSTSLVLPCINFFARTTFPPNASPIA